MNQKCQPIFKFNILGNTLICFLAKCWIRRSNTTLTSDTRKKTLQTGGRQSPAPNKGMKKLNLTNKQVISCLFNASVTGNSQWPGQEVIQDVTSM